MENVGAEDRVSLRPDTDVKVTCAVVRERKMARNIRQGDHGRKSYRKSKDELLTCNGPCDKISCAPVNSGMTSAVDSLPAILCRTTPHGRSFVRTKLINCSQTGGMDVIRSAQGRAGPSLGESYSISGTLSLGVGRSKEPIAKAPERRREGQPLPARFPLKNDVSLDAFVGQTLGKIVDGPAVHRVTGIK